MKHRKRKMLLSLIIVLLISAACSIPANAQEEAAGAGYYEEQMEASGASSLFNGLPEETQDYLESIGLESVDFYSVFNASPRTVINLILNIFSDGMSAPFKAAIKIIGLIMLLAVAECFLPESEQNKKAVMFAGGAMIALSIAAPLSQVFGGAVSAINISSNFMVALIPVFAGVITASGNPTLALSFNSMTFTAAQGISGLANNFIVPFTGIFMATGIVGSVAPEFNLNSIAGFIKKIIFGIMSFAATLFAGMLSVKGIMANAADTLAAKGIKLAVSSFIPVVGGALSDAYSSILGSLQLVKSTIGVFGIAAVALINLPVIIQLLIWIVCLKLAGAAAEIIGQKNIVSLLDAVCGAIVLLNAIIIFSAALLIISIGITLSIKAG